MAFRLIGRPFLADGPLDEMPLVYPGFVYLGVDLCAFSDLGVCCLPSGEDVGACCVNDECFLASVADCNTAGGTHLGAGVSCSPNPCGDLPTGACCVGFVCGADTTEDQCNTSGGQWLGQGTTCLNSPCERGACFEAEAGVCHNHMTEAQCNAWEPEGIGGAWLGALTNCCDEGGGFFPEWCGGACCHDGSNACSDGSFATCFMGFVSYFDGASCTSSPCGGIAAGVGDVGCVTSTQFDCQEVGGLFLFGENLDCTDCPPAEPIVCCCFLELPSGNITHDILPRCQCLDLGGFPAPQDWDGNPNTCLGLCSGSGACYQCDGTCVGTVWQFCLTENGTRRFLFGGQCTEVQADPDQYNWGSCCYTAGPFGDVERCFYGFTRNECEIELPQDPNILTAFYSADCVPCAVSATGGGLCPGDLSACCFKSEFGNAQQCENVPNAESCFYLGGVYYAGQPCTFANPIGSCPGNAGACCQFNGGGLCCQELTPDVCALDPLNLFLGSGVGCSVAECPDYVCNP